MAGTLLLDTSVVIALVEEAGRADLLDRLATGETRIEIPSNVFGELESNRTRLALRESAVVHVLEVEHEAVYHEYQQRFRVLGRGELSVLARAHELRSKEEPYECVLDDKQARNAAKRLGFPLTGTVGLLHRLQDRGELDPTDVGAIFDRLQAAGFRYPPGRHGA